MTTPYTKTEKSQEDEYGPKRVFTLNHSDIPKGITQCPMEKHKFEKKSDNEVYCPSCNTVLIVNTETLDGLLAR